MLSAAKPTCPSWAAQAGMEMAYGDVMLADELKTHYVGHWTSESFSEATVTVAWNCQQGGLRKYEEKGYWLTVWTTLSSRLRHSGGGRIGPSPGQVVIESLLGRGLASLIPNIATTFLLELDDLVDGSWRSSYRALTGVVGRFVERTAGLVVGN